MIAQARALIHVAEMSLLLNVSEQPFYAQSFTNCKTATSVWSFHNLLSNKHAEGKARSGSPNKLTYSHTALAQHQNGVSGYNTCWNSKWAWDRVWHITEVFLNRTIITGCYALACTLSVNLRCTPTRKRQERYSDQVHRSQPSHL